FLLRRRRFLTTTDILGEEGGIHPDMFGELAGVEDLVMREELLQVQLKRNVVLRRGIPGILKEEIERLQDIFTESGHGPPCCRDRESIRIGGESCPGLLEDEGDFLLEWFHTRRRFI